MKTAILICTRNRAPQLRLGLQSLVEREYKGIEIVVLDDGSTDDTPRVLKEYGRHISAHRLDRPGGWLLNPSLVWNHVHTLTDADIVIEQGGEICHLNDCVSPLLNHCRPGRVALARVHNGSVRAMTALRTTIALGHYKFPPDFIPDTVPFCADRLPIPKMNGADLFCGWERPIPFFFCAAISRQDFQTVGGYDEHLERNNDGDLARKLWAANVQFCFVGEAIAFHLEHPKL